MNHILTKHLEKTLCFIQETAMVTRKNVAISKAQSLVPRHSCVGLAPGFSTDDAKEHFGHKLANLSVENGVSYLWFFLGEVSRRKFSGCKYDQQEDPCVSLCVEQGFDPGESCHL